MTNRAVPPCIMSLAIALFWLAPTSISIADDSQCGPVTRLLTDNAEQELFYRGPNNEWNPVPADGLALTTSRANLIYVTREFLPDQQRSGAIVLKTGRGIQAGEYDPEPINKRIRLKRLRQIEFESCRGTEAPFYKNRISAAEYDRFHDYGYDASNDVNGNMLREFHTKYIGRTGCNTSTDNASLDAPLRWDWRSNRSQFSFNESVVAGGFFSQILAGAGFTRAAAVGSTGLANQRVEIIKYRMSARKIACIPINIKLTGPNFFVRVNDLEGAPAGRRQIRSGELARQLTR